MNTSTPTTLLPQAPLLKTHGSGFPPQAIDAVWLSQSEAAVALSDRWAVVPNQAVRIMGPVDNVTNQPQWQAVAKVEAIQPYLDGQRISLTPCWGSIAANAAWLEGLAEPIDFLLDTTLAQHPTARSMQLLGQPIGVAQPLQGQGWLLTGTCVAGKQAVLKELLAGFKAGWILDASGWYGLTVSTAGQSIKESSNKTEVIALQRFELAKHLCDALGDALSASEKTALLYASTGGVTTLYHAIKALCEAATALPPVPEHAIEDHYWNMAAIPTCWQAALAALWVQFIGHYQPTVVVIIWPESIKLDTQNLFKQWREQGTCVVWIPLGASVSYPKGDWNHVVADIAWPLEAMESDALGSVLSTENLPYDVAFTTQGPTTWQLPVTWALPGAVLPSGPVEWQAYGIQNTPSTKTLSSVYEQPAPIPLVEIPWVPEEPIEKLAEEGTETPYAGLDEPEFNMPVHEGLLPSPHGEMMPDEPTGTAAPLPTGLMAELGPLPDLSDLSSLDALLAQDATANTAIQIETTHSHVPKPDTSEVLLAPTQPLPSPKPAPILAESIMANHTTFAEGQAVRHAKYGHGTILQVIPTGKRHTLQVAFETAGTRLLDATQSGLELL